MPNSPGLVRQRRPTRRRRSSSNCSASSPINIGRSASPQARRRQASRSSRELAGLRFLVLSHIEELEKKLEKLDPIPDLHNFPNRDGATPPSLSNDPPTSSAHIRSNENNVDDLPTWDSEFDFSVEDLRTWVHDSLEQLAHLRSEVSARLPDLEEVKSHFPDFEFDFELPNLNVEEFLARLSRMEVPNLSSSFGDVTSRIGDLGYEYLPALSERLHNLHSHLKSRSSRLPNGSEFRTMALDKANTILRDFIDTLMYNEEDSPLERTRVNLEVEQTVVQVQQALRTSMFGQRLISYDQLPLKWRNNEHVLHGYRFIPASEWPTLLLSTFHLHNETANIHTHLLPLLILSPMFAYEAYTATSALTMLPTTLFSIFAMLCLLTSVAWHICAGCASPQVMETAARIDYLGIGWLISASIATIVYYSFSCRKMAFSIYLGMNILAGLAGSILPFMQWFNERKHKKWRIVFFLSLALTGFIPIVHMCMIHSAHETLHYILPIVPSLASYIIGLLFYAFHFPECLWPAHHHDNMTYEKEYKYQQPPPARWTDWVGGGSHAIWHTFIMAAILLHRNAIPTLTKGLGGECCDVWGRY